MAYRPLARRPDTRVRVVTMALSLATGMASAVLFLRAWA